MKPRSRKFFSAIALVAGLALVFFEVRRALALAHIESWFWLIVGGLVIVLAAAEFLPGRPRDDGHDDTD